MDWWKDARKEGVGNGKLDLEAGTLMTYTNWTQWRNQMTIMKIMPILHLSWGTGSWNDLSNRAKPDPSSPYYPQDYIVEYGGMPGDPVLQISQRVL
jgi:hypothetical protein